MNANLKFHCKIVHCCKSFVVENFRLRLLIWDFNYSYLKAHMQVNSNCKLRLFINKHKKCKTESSTCGTMNLLVRQRNTGQEFDGQNSTIGKCRTWETAPNIALMENNRNEKLTKDKIVRVQNHQQVKEGQTILYKSVNFYSRISIQHSFCCMINSRIIRYRFAFKVENTQHCTHTRKVAAFYVGYSQIINFMSN